MNNTEQLDEPTDAELQALEDREMNSYAGRAQKCGSAFILAILIDLAKRDGIAIDPVTRRATRIS